MSYLYTKDNQGITISIEKPTNISRNNGQLAQWQWSNDNGPDPNNLSHLMNCMEIDWGNASWDATDINISDLINGGGLKNIKSSYDVLRLLMWCYQQITGETYIVSFDANGGNSNSVPAPITGLHKNDTVDISSYTATRDSDGDFRYTFIGWSLTSDGQPITESNISVTSNIILYAVWQSVEIPMYTLTLVQILPDNPQSSRYLAEIHKHEGNEITYEDYIEQSLNVTGYTFIGWADNQNNIIELPTVMPSSNTFIHTVYKINQYTISWNNKGNIVKTTTQNYNTPLNIPDIETGEHFIGWFTAETGGNKVNNTTVVKSNMTLYAHYDEVQQQLYWYGGQVIRDEYNNIDMDNIYNIDINNIITNDIVDGKYTEMGWHEFNENTSELQINMSNADTTDTWIFLIPKLNNNQECKVYDPISDESFDNGHSFSYSEKEINGNNYYRIITLYSDDNIFTYKLKITNK